MDKLKELLTFACCHMYRKQDYEEGTVTITIEAYFDDPGTVLYYKTQEDDIEKASAEMLKLIERWKIKSKENPIRAAHDIINLEERIKRYGPRICSDSFDSQYSLELAKESDLLKIDCIDGEYKISLKEGL